MTTFSQQLDLLEKRAREIIPFIRRGIEKESLRITADGRLSQRDHPETLGSALTHPSITTDYSEALIELVTPTFTTVEETLDCLDELHRVVYHNCPDEMLWVNSLPCLLGDESEIPIAKFGTSNVGRMKHIYRRGLELRYGRKMQTIAGIHYNVSVPNAFWELQMQSRKDSLQDIASNGYMAGVRNFHRYCWLLFYLFGASPAACRSFFGNVDTSRLSEFSTHTLYGPYATSMRMSDIGYRNPVQSEIHVDHNSVERYAETLSRNTTTPYPKYVEHGIKRNGEYIQLNPNLLQIENEYYSVIRPKRTIRPHETPTRALKERGVEYLELRCLDLDPYSPIGISSAQARFLDLFVVYCLLRPSPMFTTEHPKTIAQNKNTAVIAGRKPGQTLVKNGTQQTLSSWGRQLLGEIMLIAEIFDDALDSNLYVETVRSQHDALTDSQLTPAARILDELRSGEEAFFDFAMRKANEARTVFTARGISPEVLGKYGELAAESVRMQHAIEESDSGDFENFLAAYFSQ